VNTALIFKLNIIYQKYDNIRDRNSYKLNINTKKERRVYYWVVRKVRAD